jgi:hypothetical protein
MVLVLARLDREAGKVIAYKDSRILGNDRDLDARLALYRRLEDLGGQGYTYTLAEVDQADQVLTERRAALEYEAGIRRPAHVIRGADNRSAVAERKV